MAVRAAAAADQEKARSQLNSLKRRSALHFSDRQQKAIKNSYCLLPKKTINSKLHFMHNIAHSGIKDS